ncbi:VOC family protein [Salinispora sp. H7-4]|uniref:VOC family protein n=1 Tax=Salinispora sp. H7-4 TaxID=2748321 RepID=UPI0015D104CF|nr:VOC family protein [Salinispora sp. H7-4]NYT95861.1 VOC family protein [Salinispora sp. H7-4]
MSDVDGTYASGTPCWFDMTVPSRDTAMDFYGPVLGWTFQGDFYTMCEVRGKPVAAIAEPHPGEPAPAQSNWTIYLATADCEAALRRVTDAGGKVVKPQQDAMVGWLAVAQDTTGGIFALWQGRELSGSQVVDEGGAPCWSEVTSADLPATVEFYRRVFGYDTKPLEDMPYVTLNSGGRPVAGVFAGAEQRPHEGHAAWLAYFQVPDAERAAEQAVSHGGRVVTAPQDSPYGRNVVLADPFGATFVAIERHG